jgi:putative protein-disulfide isomerase
MKLHYIFDPLCGWCYAAAPLVAAATSIPDLTVVPHAGGMMIGTNRREITPQWRDYVMPHDKRIAQMTGQVFGGGYYEGLLRNNGAVLDSEPPTTAILAAEQIAGKGLALLSALQIAHYVEGKVIADAVTISEAAQHIGLDSHAFQQALTTLSGAPTMAHIAQSRQLLSELNGHGFPTFAIEKDGQFMQIDTGSWLGKPQEWKDYLQSLM